MVVFVCCGVFSAKSRTTCLSQQGNKFIGEGNINFDGEWRMYQSNG